MNQSVVIVFEISDNVSELDSPVLINFHRIFCDVHSKVLTHEIFVSLVGVETLFRANVP